MDSAVQQMGIILPPEPARLRQHLEEPRLSPEESMDVEELSVMNMKTKPLSRLQKDRKTDNFKIPNFHAEAQKYADPEPRTSLSAIGTPAAPRTIPGLQESNSELTPNTAYFPCEAALSLQSLNPRRTVPAARSKTKLKQSESSFAPVIHSLSEVQPPDLDMGPWSTEAGDLFDWRPPDWESRKGQMTSTVDCVD
jgi:hypothetical protein